MIKSKSMPKIIICLVGGLGNQMFQYAFYKSLLLRGIDVYFAKNYFEINSDRENFLNFRLNYFEIQNLKIADINLYKDLIDWAHFYTVKQLIKIKANIFIILKTCFIKIIRKILDVLHIKYNLKKTYYFEGINSKEFYKAHIDATTNMYLYGWYQAYDYITPIRNHLLNDFEFKLTMPKSISEILNDINNTNSVAIHVRRGDYKNYSFLHEIATITYYKNAVEYIRSSFSNVKFFLFCNEIDSLKDDFNCIGNYTMVDTTKECPPDYFDLFLMSRARHNIICNSSFGWWAAWLNRNPSKVVIVPEKWMTNDYITTNEICPPEWIRIPIK
jgi:hypothetical protein